MYALGSISSYITAPFHPFGGAVDIIVVQQEDGSFKSSPWYVRFGKFQGVLKTREKVVNISVNGVEAGFHMYLDHKGEAYFLKDCDSQDDGDCFISPPPFRDEMDENVMSVSFTKSQSCNYDADPEENGNANVILTKSSSRRSAILRLMFGRKSMRENDQGGGIEMVNAREHAEIAAELLETKWSTNLHAGNHKGDNHTDLNDFDAIDDENEIFGSYKEDTNENFETGSVSKEHLEEVVICNSSIITTSCGGDLKSCSNTVETTKELVCTQDEKLGDSLEPNLVREVHFEESFTHTSSPGVHEEVLEVYTSESGDVGGRSNTVTETVIVRSDEYTISSKESVLNDVASDARCPVEFNISSQEVIFQERESDGISQEKVNRIEVVDSVRIQCQMSEEATSPSNSHVPLTNDQDQELKRLSNEVKVEKVFPSDRLRISQVESKHSEDELFSFGDTDSFAVDKIKQEVPVGNAGGETDDLEELDSEDSNHEECFESVSEVSGSHASPLAVPRSNTHLRETESFDELLGADSLTKSLPIIRSQIHDLERSNFFHPRSCSLDLNQDFPRKEISIFSKLETDCEGNRTDGSCTSEIAATTVGLENNQGDKASHVQLAVGAIVPSGGRWRLWPFGLNKSKKALSTAQSVSESSTLKNVDFVSMRSQSMSDNYDIRRSKISRKQVQSLTPSSEQLSSLNLRDGNNVIAFNFSTAMLGQQQVHARIYLWKWNTRIVISDVDGTITKSDVLGQFMPLVGKDWSHTGVTHLFSAIKENGYQLLFLSARSISQAYLTRQFLFNLKQDGKALPDGPVVISPDGLFPSLYREVIRRAPHEFKISCLEDIRALFPPQCNPFYAGFGNRDTDEFSYLKVGIPKGKIFIINPKGEVVVNRGLNTRSYTSLHAVVNGMFPSVSTAEQEDFNSWNYWKLPLSDIDI